VCKRHFKPECLTGSSLRKTSIPTEELGYEPVDSLPDFFWLSKPIMCSMQKCKGMDTAIGDVKVVELDSPFFIQQNFNLAWLK